MDEELNKRGFEVGDWAYCISTFKQLAHGTIGNKITKYKIIQIVSVSDYHTIYNTKHGAFRNYNIGVTAFFTEEDAKRALTYQ